MNFAWNNYSSEHTEKIEAFLDKEAIKYTSCENGFDDFYTYWYNDVSRNCVPEKN